MSRWVLLWVSVLLTLLTCCDAPPPADARAPVGMQAGVVIEPPWVMLGEVAIVEIAVITPPDHRVPPVKPPVPPIGFWLLDAELLPVAQSPGRWVHRTRFRIRSREVGEFEWPAQTVGVEGPDGVRTELALSAHPIEVRSVLPASPEASEPRPLRAPPAPARSVLLPAAAGALAALSLVGCVAWARRTARARRTQARAPESSEAAGLIERTHAGLDEALVLLERDPRRAADQAAASLRRYLEDRYPVKAVARTTEELLALRAPLAATTRWSRYLEVLSRLDAARFPPEATRKGPGHTREAIRDARSLILEAPGRFAMRPRRQ